MGKSAVDPEEYKKTISLILAALSHNALKARTGKSPEEQVGHAKACESLANAFVCMYKPGLPD